MSTLLAPVGPKGPGVYWVRRLLVVVVVLALVLGVRAVFFGGGGTPTATPTPDQSTSPEPTSSSSEKPTSSGSATPKPSPSTSSGTGPCKDSQIQVTTSTDAASYQVGATPRLRMRIQNTSKSACKRDIGSKANELVISSGTTRVWSSDDCNSGGASQVVVLGPGESYSVGVTWLGRLSQKGCPADQPIAAAGTYKLEGRNGGLTSDPAVFALTAAA